MPSRVKAMRVSSLSMICAAICLATAADSQKRVPSGFTGVRGKKSTTEEEAVGVYGAGERLGGVYAEDEEEGVKGAAEKRAPTDFFAMRGKKPSEQWSSGARDYGIKRTPSGFLGMRGKKEIDYDEIEKRAPSGFMGMRGKKEFDPIFDPFYEKRVPSSGFMGMRGKKDVEGFVEDKRAPASGFFGMRGKKQPGRSSFFGMRGKKFPYEFRGKFVGVRGKKMSEPANGGGYFENAGRDEEEALDFNQLMYLLTGNEGYYPERETAFNGQEYSLN